MKSKLLLFLFLIVGILTITACNKNTQKKTIELYDQKLGYKTTFYYDEKENYSDVIADNSNKSTEIEFSNQDLNLQFKMYYYETGKSIYENSKEKRANKKYYKEYTFGEYKAYGYSDYNDQYFLIITLSYDEKAKAYNSIFVSIEQMSNDKEKSVYEVVNDKKVQELLNSITFEEKTE